jgi:hypothetical protein
MGKIGLKPGHQPPVRRANGTWPLGDSGAACGGGRVRLGTLYGPAPDGMVWFPGGEFSMGTAAPPEIDRVGMQATGYVTAIECAPRASAARWLIEREVEFWA